MPGDASRGSMRGVGRVGVALDVTCGCSGLERFEWAAYIVYRSRKARKHVTGTLLGLPDEHFCRQNFKAASAWHL